MMARPSDIIALDVQLWDYAVDKYVRARVYADGFEMPYSPVFVPHKANGYYFLLSSLVVFPDNIQHFSIIYEVYKDSGFTQVSKRHAPHAESYVLDEGGGASGGTDPSVIDKLNQVIDIVSSHDLNSQIFGEVIEDFSIEGHVLHEMVVGSVNDDNTLEGYVVSEESIDTVLSDNDDISGTLE